MLTPEQRAKIEREQSSWVRSHIKGPRANAPGGFYRAMDDIRHELVERPWYGRQVTGDLMESRPDLHRSVYGSAPQAGDEHCCRARHSRQSDRREVSVLLWEGGDEEAAGDRAAASSR